MASSALQEAFLSGIKYAETGSFKNPDEQVSSEGAISSMQVLPSTALDPGLKGVTPLKPNELGDMSKVNAFGRQYASALLDRYGGDVERAAGAYVRGFGDEDEQKPLGPKSANYVQKVSQFVNKQLEEQPEDTPTEQPVTPPVETTAPPVEEEEMVEAARVGVTDPSKLKTAATYSKSFQDAVENIPDGFQFTNENLSAYAIQSGFEPKSFIEAGQRLKKDFEAGGDGVPDRTSFGRTIGRALGETFEGVTDTAGFLVRQLTDGDKIVETFGDIVDEVQGKYVSSDVIRAAKNTFDPAHPEHIGGDAEYVVGHIGSYLIPATGVVKGINAGQKVVEGVTKGRLLGPSLREIDDQIAKLARTPGVGKVKLKPEAAQARRAAKIRKVAGDTVKYELGFAGAASIVESPDENFVNILVKEFPETMEFLKPFQIDKEDTEAEQRLQAFLNNIGLGVVTGPVLSSPFLVSAFRSSGQPSAKQIANTVNRLEKSSVGNATTSLKELGEAATGKKATRLQKIKGRLTSRMGTNDPLLASIIKMEQAGPAALAIAKATTRELRKAAQKDFGRKAFKNEQTILKMNEALGGNKEAIAELSEQAPNVSKVIETMRNDIDDLSRAIAGNLPEGNLKIAIDDGYNSYLNRTYKAYDDANWKGLDDPFFETAEGLQVRNSAIKALKDKGFNENDIPLVMEWIAKGMPQSGTRDIVALNRRNNAEIKDFIQTLSDFSSLQGSSPIAGRTKIEKPFRELMGEVKSPFENYAKTFEKLSIIKAEQDYMREVIQNLRKFDMAEEGLGRLPRTEGYVPFKSDILDARLNRLGGGYRRGTQISSDGTTKIPQSSADAFSAQFNELVEKEFGFPLERLYVNPVYAEAIKNGTEILAPQGALGRGWVATKALSQIMKTVASPATHVRNVMGNNIIMIANGMLPVSLRGEATAFVKRLADMETRQIAEELAEAIRVGVIDSGVKAGTVKAQMKDFAANPQGRISKILDKTAVTRLGRGVARKTFRLYQDEDNLYKFIHYNKTKNYLANAGYSGDELIEEAAKRTRDLMPNYNLVSRQLKHMRRWPVGDFLSFPAEMVRVTKNLVKYTLQDIRSGNPTLMREGMKRLGGMTAAGLGTDMAMNYSMDMFGITAEQADNLNYAVEEYERDVPKLFLSPIYEDANKKNVVQYVNFGPIDPFDYIKFAGRAIHNALLTNQDVDPVDVGFRILFKQMAPFAKPSMVIQAAEKVALGTRDFDSERENDIAKMIKHALDPFAPGFLPAIRRYKDYYEGLEQLNENRIGRGAIGPYGQSLGEGDADLAANLLGIRVQTFDINNALAQKVGRSLRKIKRAKSAFTQSDAYSEFNISKREDLVNAYINSQELKHRDLKELRNTLKVFRKLTPNGRPLTRDELEQALTKQERFALKDTSLLDQALNNVFVPDELTGSNLQFLEMSGKITSNDPAIRAIEEYMAEVAGTRLEEKE
jgi:hypothetical protein